MRIDQLTRRYKRSGRSHLDVTHWFEDDGFKTSSTAFLLFVFLEQEGTVFGHEGGAVEE